MVLSWRSHSDVASGTHSLRSTMTNDVMLVLQDVGILSMTIEVYSIPRQGSVGVVHGVPRFRHATSLTLHDYFSGVVNS